jgi:hypothetical protein
MAGTNAPPDTRVDEIAEEVRALRHRVDELTLQVRALASAGPAAGDFHPELEGPSRSAAEGGATAPPGAVSSTGAASATAGDEVSGAATRREGIGETLLSSVATVCFLLVVALILRTIVDNGMIDQQFGAFVGMGYAGLLIAFGYRRYARSPDRVPVYAICGALLLFSVVLETHNRFELLSAPLAHGVLASALVVMAAMGLQYGRASPICVGVLGASLVGLALGFPDPAFPPLAALLLLASAAASVANRIPRSRWLAWGVLVVTLSFWSLWATKVRAPLLLGELPGPERALPWLLPGLALFALVYTGTAVWAVLRGRGGFGPAESVFMVMNVAWIYAVARAVVLPWYGRADLVGASGVVAAGVYLSLGMWLSRGGRTVGWVATPFAAAALILLAAALPEAAGDLAVTLLVWSAVALGLAVTAERWQHGGLRAAAYLLQAFACAMAVASGRLSVLLPLPGEEVAVAALLSGVCAIHYVWMSGRAPKPKKGHLGLSGILLLLAALVYAFGASRMGLFAGLVAFGLDGGSAFQCGQSILVNLAALVLMLLGLMRRNRELLAAGAVAAGAGAVKVFGYDLLTASGLPLVLGVLSFGIAASVASLVWRRWQHQVS